MPSASENCDGFKIKGIRKIIMIMMVVGMNCNPVPPKVENKYNYDGTEMTATVCR